MIRIIIMVLFIVARPAAAQDNDLLMIGLADDRVAITTGFHGSRLTLFGLKRRYGDIAVLIEGPEKDVVVRHKERLMGIWVNSESFRFRRVPAYYDYAVSTPEAQLASPDLLKANHIGLDALDFDYSGRKKMETVLRFKEAMIRNRQGQGHFPLSAENIYFLNHDFFKVGFDLPADVPAGNYRIKAYLFDDGKILDKKETGLRVGQDGASARIYNFAHGRPFSYGIIAVLLALFSGWGAWALVQRE